ncbi:LAMI_0B01772g1_1 [Lachancea mirantina]|uniref:LAMI_0B01772g1_1 n=1 Tax=Lachancea mirantina TaxID=1230905 RepID=A0A1G4IUD1_9SACH|nr:LAMI_0B01772g1_1 [Lachancea mirantina]
MSINLELILGFKVKITNVLDGVTVGRIYSYNSSNNTITLTMSGKSNHRQQFKIIKVSFIKRLDVLSDLKQAESFRKDLPKPNEVDIKQVEESLQREIKRAQGRSKLIGKNVTTEGQYVFDAVHKSISKSEWNGKTIVVLGEVLIYPPYLPKNIKPLGDATIQSFAWVTKIVEGAWKKLESEEKGG